MITKLDSSVKFEDDMIGVVVEKSPVIKPGESLKVRIPVYMPNIPEGKPSVFSKAINPMSTFVNDSSCRPALSSHIIKEQNYLTAKLYTGEDITEIVTEEKSKKQGAEPKKYIKQGEKVSVSFSNGKMSKIYFETSVYK
jgi:hypothetical protein